MLEPTLAGRLGGRLNSRWVSLRLLDYDEALGASLRRFLGFDLLEDLEVTARLKEAREHIAAGGIPPEKLQDALVSGIVLRAEEACMGAVFFESAGYNAGTGSWTGGSPANAPASPSCCCSFWASFG